MRVTVQFSCSLQHLQSPPPPPPLPLPLLLLPVQQTLKTPRNLLRICPSCKMSCHWQKERSLKSCRCLLLFVKGVPSWRPLLFHHTDGSYPPPPPPHTHTMFQDHEALKRSNADLERQVKEWQLALEEAEERYSELQGKHQMELEGVRKAGHDTLAVIVEEYKV